MSGAHVLRNDVVVVRREEASAEARGGGGAKSGGNGHTAGQEKDGGSSERPGSWEGNPTAEKKRDGFFSGAGDVYVLSVTHKYPNQP